MLLTAHETLTLVSVCQTIGVYGELNLFGVLPQPAWTKLNVSVTAGAQVLQLAQPVNWKVGDTIAIAVRLIRSVAVVL